MLRSVSDTEVSVKESTESESKFAQALGTGSTGHDSSTTLHDDFHARGVIRFNQRDIFEIDEMRAMDAQEVGATQLSFHIGQPNADKIFLRSGKDGHVVVRALHSFQDREGNRNNAI